MNGCRQGVSDKKGLVKPCKLHCRTGLTSTEIQKYARAAHRRRGGHRRRHRWGAIRSVPRQRASSCAWRICSLPHSGRAGACACEPGGMAWSAALSKRCGVGSGAKWEAGVPEGRGMGLRDMATVGSPVTGHPLGMPIIWIWSAHAGAAWRRGPPTSDAGRRSPLKPGRLPRSTGVLKSSLNLPHTSMTIRWGRPCLG